MINTQTKDGAIGTVKNFNLASSKIFDFAMVRESEVNLWSRFCTLEYPEFHTIDFKNLVHEDARVDKYR